MAGWVFRIPPSCHAATGIHSPRRRATIPFTGGFLLPRLTKLRIRDQTGRRLPQGIYGGGGAAPRNDTNQGDGHVRERDDDVWDTIERMHEARQKRSDAAWPFFEEKWSSLVATAYTTLRKVRRNKFMRGTTAEADAEADLNGLYVRMVKRAAETACEQDFETRSGFRVLARVLGRDALCVVYNNNPYAGMPTRRDKELEEYRAWLADMGVDELAYAEHPDRGRDEGYSYALLLGCVAGSESYIEEQYWAITLKGSFGTSGARG